MDIAKRVAQQSTALNAQVGAVMVRGDNILAVGYNGTPKGWSNNCEYMHLGKLTTKPEVLHAESNMIAKVARSTQSSEGSTVYTTLSPCLECSKMMYQAGVVRVVYADDYRDKEGLAFLDKANITVEKIDG